MNSLSTTSVVITISHFLTQSDIVSWIHTSRTFSTILTDSGSTIVSVVLVKDVFPPGLLRWRELRDLDIHVVPNHFVPKKFHVHHPFTSVDTATTAASAVTTTTATRTTTTTTMMAAHNQSRDPLPTIRSYSNTLVGHICTLTRLQRLQLSWEIPGTQPLDIVPLSRLIHLTSLKWSLNTRHNEIYIPIPNGCLPSQLREFHTGWLEENDVHALPRTITNLSILRPTMLRGYERVGCKKSSATGTGDNDDETREIRLNDRTIGKKTVDDLPSEKRMGWWRHTITTMSAIHTQLTTLHIQSLASPLLYETLHLMAERFVKIHTLTLLVNVMRERPRRKIVFPALTKLKILIGESSIRLHMPRLQSLELVGDITHVPGFLKYPLTGLTRLHCLSAMMMTNNDFVEHISSTFSSSLRSLSIVRSNDVVTLTSLSTLTCLTQLHVKWNAMDKLPMCPSLLDLTIDTLSTDDVVLLPFLYPRLQSLTLTLPDLLPPIMPSLPHLRRLCVRALNHIPKEHAHLWFAALSPLCVITKHLADPDTVEDF